MNNKKEFNGKVMAGVVISYLAVMLMFLLYGRSDDQKVSVEKRCNNCHNYHNTHEKAL